MVSHGLDMIRYDSYNIFQNHIKPPSVIQPILHNFFILMNGIGCLKLFADSIHSGLDPALYMLCICLVDTETN